MSDEKPISLNTHEPDACCGKHLSKALRSGLLDSLDTWMCPKCGMEWQPRMVETLRHWEPHPVILIF